MQTRCRYFIVMMVLTLLASSSAMAQDKPNIVLILMDNFGWGELGVYGGGVGKIFKIGKQAVNAQVGAYKNVESPDFGPDWQFRLQLQYLFPK